MSSEQNGSNLKHRQNVIWNGMPIILAVLFALTGIIEINAPTPDSSMVVGYLLGAANLLAFASVGSSPIGYIFWLFLLGLGVGWLFRNLWEKGRKFRFILLAVFISNSLCWALIIIPILNSMFSD